MKKLISVFILALVLCLAGCSNSNNDKDSHKNDEKKSESKAKSKSERFKEYDDNSEAYEEAKKKYNKQKPISMLNKLDPIMTDKTFTNQKGIQGWKDYKKLMDKVKLADYKYTKESKGSSLDDVDAFFKVPYSVAQMNYEALPVTNVSILVKGEKEKDEKADSNYLAYFNFSPVKYDKDKNHEVVSVNGAPFESAQADFGNYAYVAMKEALKEAL